MSDVYGQSYQQAVSKTEPRPQNWLVILDYVFYIALALAIVGFLYYVYIFRDYALLYAPFLLQAAGTTIMISLVSMVLATIFGFIGALGRLSRFVIVRSLATVYVEVVRGTPILVQLLLWGFGVATLLSNAGFDPYSFAFQVLTPFQENSLVSPQFTFLFYGVIGLSFNYGAYLTEVFRTGIESINKGQTEAALSLGMNSSQTMRHIVLPQAIRITIPPFTNYFITLIQDSALLSVVGVIELEQTIGSFAYPQTDSNVKLFVFVFGALFYFIICYPLSLVARYLEARMARAY
jgi:polar amino acid transport system permease protein